MPIQALDIRAAAVKRSDTIGSVLQERLIGLLAARLGAKSIWLFGSAARGEATRDSDADLLVVSGDAVAHLPWRTRWNVGADAVEEAMLPFGCDLVVWSEVEFSEKRSEGHCFVLNILKEGVLLYERSK
jgi:predicted nucleotidyltransferase